MALQVYCPTSRGVLLLAVPAATGVYHFPLPIISETGHSPGLWLEVTPLLAINPQLVALAEEVLGYQGLGGKLNINQDFTGSLTDPQGNKVTLYVATLEPGLVEVVPTWPTLPQLLAGMPKDRNRLPYVLAWQVLTGALSQQTYAVELDKALATLEEASRNKDI